MPTFAILIVADTDGLHEKDHIELRRIPDGQTLHHLLRSFLFFPLDMRRTSDHDSDYRQGVDVGPRHANAHWSALVVLSNAVILLTTRAE